MQVLLADLAGVDLCLLPTSVDVRLQVKGTESVGLESAPSNDRRRIRITLPTKRQGEGSDLRHLQLEVVSVIMSLLSELSLMPNDRIKKTMDDLFRRELPAKIFVAETYDRLFKNFVSEEFYALGKLIQLGFGTNNYDGNTTLCMASAVSGYKMSFGSDGPPGAYEDL